MAKHYLFEVQSKRECYKRFLLYKIKKIKTKILYCVFIVIKKA